MILNIVSTINKYLSDYVLIFCLISVGLFYTINTKAVQIRCFGEGLKKMFGNFNLNGKKVENSMSSFQALSTAIAAQVGTGNIVGASGAILIGGPGAIFWMWVIAFFGMATIYAEATLAIQTRHVGKDGTMKGGPAYYMREAFKNNFGKFLSTFFAIAAIVSLGFFGAMVQSNSIAETFNTAFNVPNYVMGIILVVFCGLIFIGGTKVLASVVEKLVPAMALVFLIGGIFVLIMRIKYIPQTFGMIFTYAFNPTAIIGGTFGMALKTSISQGVKRGLFSNEAGMGSTPHAHALATVEDPHDQGVVAMMGVFLDTFVVLTLNALVIISTLYTSGGILENGQIPDYISKSNLAQTAFGLVMGESVGSTFVAICLFFFAVSTILSWNLFGKTNMKYLFGDKSVIIYNIIAIAFVFFGTMISNDLVWELQDMFNQLMVIPNVLTLFVLYKLVLKIAKVK